MENKKKKSRLALLISVLSIAIIIAIIVILCLLLLPKGITKTGMNVFSVIDVTTSLNDNQGEITVTNEVRNLNDNYVIKDLNLKLEYKIELKGIDAEGSYKTQTQLSTFTFNKDNEYKCINTFSSSIILIDAYKVSISEYVDSSSYIVKLEKK